MCVRSADSWHARSVGESAAGAGFSSIEAVADAAAALVFSVLAAEQSRGAPGCVVGGWSYGGIVALELAARIQSTGVVVGGVVLIDAPIQFAAHAGVPTCVQPSRAHAGSESARERLHVEVEARTDAGAEADVQSIAEVELLQGLETVMATNDAASSSRLNPTTSVVEAAEEPPLAEAGVEEASDEPQVAVAEARRRARRHFDRCTRLLRVHKTSVRLTAPCGSMHYM